MNMRPAERFLFVNQEGALGEASWMPFVPLQLRSSMQSVEGMGLLDSGATVNVLPFSFGNLLGLVWEEQRTAVRLTGNLSNYEAHAVLLKGQVGALSEVQLAFAWTRADNVPMILGQVNFFMEFDVCFFRSQRTFEVRSR
jgi:hypothetical protein